VGVLIGIGLIVAGVAILGGLAWALITGGSLIAVGAVGTGVALLSEPDKEESQ
jgi:flagellar motor component MotA